jgi:phosphate transport system substrate-binding protein
MEQRCAVLQCPAAQHRGKTLKERLPMYKKILPVTLLTLLLACSVILREPTSVIYMKGSDTMVILAQKWAGAYMAGHSGVSVYADGGGTGAGFAALIDGKADIALASRLIKPEEAHLLADKYNAIGMSFLVARDALCVYLSYENPVSDLSMEQIRDIFSGRITNWREVGGIDARIEVIIRPPTSGTYGYFKELALANGDFSERAASIPTTSAIAQYVNLNRDAIGFGGIAYGNAVKHCSINGIPATEENVRNDTYPLGRYLYLYTISKPGRAAWNLIDWIIGPEGQSIVREVGYIPIWQEDRR